MLGSCLLIVTQLQRFVSIGCKQLFIYVPQTHAIMGTCGYMLAQTQANTHNACMHMHVCVFVY